jgi:Fe2+ or Zn2+ uptake regulation protein
MKALSREQNPISVAVIQQKIGKNGSASTASLYRTLETLTENGIVNRIHLSRLQPFYELISGRKHHHHVTCDKCGDMEDVEAAKDCPAEKLRHRILDRSDKFAFVSNHSLEFFGLCKKCA